MHFRDYLTQALERLCHVVAGVAFLVALVATVIDVVGRKVLGVGIQGIVDIVGFCVVTGTMFGIAVAWSQRVHIAVDLLDMTGSSTLIFILDLLTRLVGIVVMPLLMWLSYREFRDMLDFGDRTPDLGIPLWWFWLSILIGYGLSAILLLIARPAGKAADV